MWCSIKWSVPLIIWQWTQGNLSSALFNQRRYSLIIAINVCSSESLWSMQTNVLISHYGCTVWSAPLLTAHVIKRVSRDCIRLHFGIVCMVWCSVACYGPALSGVSWHVMTLYWGTRPENGGNVFKPRNQYSPVLFSRELQVTLIGCVVTSARKRSSRYWHHSCVICQNFHWLAAVRCLFSICFACTSARQVHSWWFRIRHRFWVL